MCDVLIAFYGRKLNGNSMENVATMSIAIKCCCVTVAAAAAAACLLQRCLCINLSFTFFFFSTWIIVASSKRFRVLCFSIRLFYFYDFPCNYPISNNEIYLFRTTDSARCLKGDGINLHIKSNANQCNEQNRISLGIFLSSAKGARLQCQWQNRFLLLSHHLNWWVKRRERVYNGSLHRDNI